MNGFLFALLLMAVTLFPSCLNPQTGKYEVPWTAIDQEIEFLIGDLESAQLVFDGEKTKETLAKAAAALTQVEAALDAYLADGGPETKGQLLAALQGAVRLTQGLLRPDAPEGTKAVLFLVESGLRRWEVYAGEVDPVPAVVPPTVEVDT